jgi:hypothetical protein
MHQHLAHVTHRIIRHVSAAVTVATLVVLGAAAAASTLTTTARGRLERAGRRDTGALSLEQAILTAVLSAAGIALGVVIVNAIVSHQANIR